LRPRPHGSLELNLLFTHPLVLAAVRPNESRFSL
jgi:hypothetical protein